MNKHEAAIIAEGIEAAVLEHVERAQEEWLFEAFMARMKGASEIDRRLVAQALEREDFL